MSEVNVPAPNRLARPLALIGAAIMAIGLLAALAGPASREAGAQTCSGAFTIDFAGLPAGTILVEQYADQGVHISGVARQVLPDPLPDALIVFDSNSTDPKLDPDLRVGIGNIAIFAKNLDDTNGDGLVDRPDENDVGGTATFAFDQEVSIGSVKWIDKDHVVDNFVVAYDAAGNVITSVPVPLGANASVQTIAVNADGVRRLEFVYQESGGFTGIEVDCGQATPTPTSTSVAQTPTPPAATPTPTEAPTPTPSPAPATPTATPEAGTSAQTPPAGAPSPIVAAAVSPPDAGTSVAAGPGALPSGGATPSTERSTGWAAALTVLALILGGTFVSRRRRSG